MGIHLHYEFDGDGMVITVQWQKRVLRASMWAEPLALRRSMLELMEDIAVLLESVKEVKDG